MNSSKTMVTPSSSNFESPPFPKPITQRLRNVLALAGSCVVIAVIGILDSWTGTELRIYPLYIVPIAFAAWRTGWLPGALMSAIATLVWILSNRIAGMNFSPLLWAANATSHLIAFISVVILVEHLRRSRAAEHRLARLDPLTELPNTRSFYEAATSEIERQKRHLRPLSLAFIDLDNFKAMNDRFGHRAGDLLLSIVAQTLRQATRTTDRLGRLGGDEFAVLMPETTEEGAQRVLDRLKSNVESAMNERNWPVSCSIGAVTVYEPPESVDELVGRADILMYSVKETGKNAIRIERIYQDGLGDQKQARVLK